MAKLTVWRWLNGCVVEYGRNKALVEGIGYAKAGITPHIIRVKEKSD